MRDAAASTDVVLGLELHKTLASFTPVTLPRNILRADDGQAGGQTAAEV